MFSDNSRTLFQNMFNLVCVRAHENAKAKGFWDDDDHSDIYDGNKIALCHGELSEALEGLRHGNPPSEHIPEFTAMEEEYADTIIRIMDHSARRGYDVAGAILAKLEFNATRPHKHGKAF